MISPVHAMYMYMCMHMYSVHTTVTVLMYVHVLVLSETWWADCQVHVIDDNVCLMINT